MWLEGFGGELWCSTSVWTEFNKMEFVVLSNPQSVGPEFDVHVFLCFFFFGKGKKNPDC